MNVGRKLMLIVFTCVVLVTLPATFGIYTYVKHKLLARETAMQIAETKTLVSANTNTIKSYENGLKALARTLNQQLSSTIASGEDAKFDHIIQNDSDGVWRNNQQLFNGKIESGIFIPSSVQLDSKQKVFHLRIKHALDAFGSSISTPTGNIWVLTLDKSEVIYDRLYPNFVSLMKPDTDYTDTPWVTLGNPSTNPNREVRWTTPIQDPVSNAWIISAIMPLDVNGKWLGTLGRDIGITKESLDIFERSDRYKGEQRFILDAEHHFIEAGPGKIYLKLTQKKLNPC